MICLRERSLLSSSVLPHITMAGLFLKFLLAADFIRKSTADGLLRGADQIKTSVEMKEKFGPSSLHIFKEHAPRFQSMDDITALGRVQHDFVHDVVFVIRQKNMDELTRILYDVSDPVSVNYGQHITREKVVTLTSNPVARDAVMAYLTSIGAHTMSATPGGEYITASAPISLWERVLDTEFFLFHKLQRNGKVTAVIRADKYSVPRELDEHLESVLNTIQMPLNPLGKLPVKMKKKMHSAAYDYATSITPSKIKSFYKVGQSIGSSSSTQGIFATIEQNFSPADLVSFFDSVGMPNQLIARSIGNHTSDAVCLKDSSMCSEANLDVQYIMGISPVSPTWFMYTELRFSSWLILVASYKDPPLVLSISYGAEEPAMSSGEVTAFNTQAIKLGAMGISIVVASGDDGAISRRVRLSGTSACGYSPFFPASSPYVLSVGATSGVEVGSPEVVCQADAGNAITSGGGFSTFTPRPPYQAAAVAQYFSRAVQAGTTPTVGYAVNGRGYPDISLTGHNYAVVIGGELFGVSGTSASCPAIAAFLSSINAARIKGGKGPVGWINPVLYANYSSFVNDITSGNNKCAVSEKVNGIPVNACCRQGFTATSGWDPTTGFGTVDYSKMQALFMKLGGFVDGVLHAPTVNPTPAPTPINVQTIAASLTPIGTSVTVVAAVVIAIIGAIVMLILLFIVYCCCCRRSAKQAVSQQRIAGVQMRTQPCRDPIARPVPTNAYRSRNAP